MDPSPEAHLPLDVRDVPPFPLPPGGRRRNHDLNLTQETGAVKWVSFTCTRRGMSSFPTRLWEEGTTSQQQEVEVPGLPSLAPVPLSTSWALLPISALTSHLLLSGHWETPRNQLTERVPPPPQPLPDHPCVCPGSEVGGEGGLGVLWWARPSTRGIPSRPFAEKGLPFHSGFFHWSHVLALLLHVLGTLSMKESHERDDVRTLPQNPTSLSGPKGVPSRAPCPAHSSRLFSMRRHHLIHTEVTGTGSNGVSSSSSSSSSSR